MKCIEVTCAIIEREGLILAAQRSAVMSMPHKWEFPGGKIHPDETPEDCLAREIREELSLTIRILYAEPLCAHDYPDIRVTLYPFVCALSEGEPVLHEHDQVLWLPPDELPALDWAAADVPVLRNFLLSRL